MKADIDHTARANFDSVTVAERQAMGDFSRARRSGGEDEFKTSFLP